MINDNEVLTELIPYRLQAVETLLTAWDWSYKWKTPKPLEVFVDGKLVLRGNSNAIVNPMIEAGIINARSLLEFLGLCEKDGKLAQLKVKRRDDDIAIEHFSVSGKPLELVTPQQAISTYFGPAADAEQALVSIFVIANKGLAHITNGVAAGRFTSDHIDIACRGIIALVNNHLYIKLGMERPNAPSINV